MSSQSQKVTPARRNLYINPSAATWTSAPFPASLQQSITKFHENFPGYKPTSLIPLDTVAKQSSVKAVFMKDESNRCSLPAFKILGASWAVHKAITRVTSLPLDVDLETMSVAAKAKGITLLAATEGNHGRAVARHAKILGVPARIFAPKHMHASTVKAIQSEGAEVIVTDGDYDEALVVAKNAACDYTKILIQDTTTTLGYEEIPQWVVDGYSTMLREIDEQLPEGKAPDLVVVPVGCGSLAQAIVRYSKQAGRNTRVLAVEPDGAPCLWKSLQSGQNQPSGTHQTIMSGMNCGEVSAIAWPVLKHGVDASMTISDTESHDAVELLRELGVDAGPCGGGTLAAFQRLTAQEKAVLGLSEDSVVVLLCTEGNRDYKVPLDVSSDDPIILSQTLIRIESTNPDLSRAGGAGEAAIAGYITSWLHHRDVECHTLERTPGRPSVVAIVRGIGGGKSLMINGHIDTVTTTGYKGDPLDAEIRNGSIYGRGAFDMKPGVATGLVTLARAKQARLRGDVLVAAVADEENLSLGTEEVLEAGWTADGAIVCEPTELTVTLAHRGFVWIEVDILGKAAHGSRPDLGIDSISKAGHFLVELDKYSAELLKRSPDPECGTGSVHASLIQGGEELSSYPAKCTISIERRTVPSETTAIVEAEFREILDRLSVIILDFTYECRVLTSRPPFHVDKENPFIKTALVNIEKTLHEPPVIRGGKFWTDCALLSEKGIPTLLFGCSGGGAHADTEWATIKSIYEVTDAVAHLAEDFCK